MITQLTPIPEFLGLVTHIDPSQVPLGGAIKVKNMAQLAVGRLRRIPGVVSVGSPTVDAQTRIPLAFWAKGLGVSGEDQLIAIFVGAGTVSVVNLSTGSVMSGPTLASPSFEKQWSATFYNNLWMFAGGGNVKIYKLDSSSVYSEVTGTSQTFTVTIASPAVFTATAHGLAINDSIFFTTTGALPTGLAANTTYYVISAGFTADAFEVSTTLGGAAVNTSGSQSGVHTIYSKNPPGGNLIQSFLNRLYISDLVAAGQEGIVAYSDSLSTKFLASSVVNVKELPGKVTALAINAPSTDTTGIETQLVIGKHSGVWLYDETRKDNISTIVGIAGIHALANTEAGLIFGGRKGTRHSVFWMPIGSIGEPVDIGEVLDDVLNTTTTLGNEILAHAVHHGRFFKLFYSVGSENNNPNELWLDTYLLATEKKVVWYGVHNRGSFDASVVADSTLELFVRGTSGAAKRYQERIDTTANFTDINGNTLVAELDLPLNVEPYADEKSFIILELQVAKEANISGNSIMTEPIAEGSSQGTINVSLYNSLTSPNGISRPQVPVHASGKVAMTAHDARIKLTHSLNQRFDILGAGIQYMRHEGASRVRSKV